MSGNCLLVKLYCLVIILFTELHFKLSKLHCLLTAIHKLALLFDDMFLSELCCLVVDVDQ